MKEELIGGMRNALERGETIEQAIQTFMNAGYSPNEVREAASFVAPSAAAALYGQTSPALPSSSMPSSAPAQPAASSKSPSLPSAPSSSPVASASPAVQPLPTTPAQPPQGKKTLVILIVVLLLLLVLLGVTYLYSDNLLALFKG